MPPTPQGVDAGAAGRTDQAGTRVADDREEVIDFDPTVGNPPGDQGGEPAQSQQDRPAAGAAAGAGDRSASGKVEQGNAGAAADPNAAAGGATNEPPAGGAADEDVDPAAEALAYYQSLTGEQPKPGTETTTDKDKPLTPDSIRAEIESATQDPQERFDKLLSKVGSMANENGTLRKERGQFAGAVEAMRPFLEFDPQSNLPVGFNGLKLLQHFTEKLGPEAINQQLAEAGLELVAKGSRASSAGDNGDDLGPILAAVAKQFQIDTEGRDEDAILAEIQSRPRAQFELNRRVHAAEADRVAKGQQAQERQRAGLQQERTEIHDYLTGLEAKVKDPKGFEAVKLGIARNDSIIPKDKPLRGRLRVQVLHRLAESDRFGEVLQTVTQKVQARERARLTKALLALGWSAADAQAVLKGTAAKAPDRIGAAAAAVPAPGEDGSHDTWGAE